MRRLAAAATIVAFLGVSCVAQESPPELPGKGSLQADLLIFKDNADETSKAGTHFNNAAIRVAAVNVLVRAGLVWPVVFYAVALAQRPTKSDGVWSWSFAIENQNNDYVATLSGTLEEEELVVAMEVDGTVKDIGTVDHYTWYEGRHGLDTGWWKLYDPLIEGANQELLEIVWNMTDETHKDLVFTITAADGREETGDELSYVLDDTAASVSLHDASSSETAVIEWNTETGAGSITAPLYNAGERSCWGGLPELADIECP
jgi:hypothetical protein